MTRQRQIILEELKKVKTHPTADELYERVRRRLPRISLGTVYRNLDVLSQFGAIQRLDLAGVQRRFDGEPEAHYHVRCITCGRVDDVSFEPMPGLERGLRDLCGYKVVGHRLEFIGLCPKCQKRRRLSHSIGVKTGFAPGA